MTKGDKFGVVVMFVAPFVCGAVASPGFFWTIFWFAALMEALLVGFAISLEWSDRPRHKRHPSGPSYKVREVDGLAVRVDK